MRENIKKIPIPFCGVMLATATLGTLLKKYSESLYWLCLFAAIVFLILILLKLFMFFALVKEEMKNNIPAGVSGTFPMALMILSTYAAPYFKKTAFYLWTFSVILNFALMTYFIIKFVSRKKLEEITPVYLVVFLGIHTAGITAPVYNAQKFGEILFWSGFVTFIIVPIVIAIRYLKHPMPAPIKPLLCIYAAPESMCLASYLSTVSEPSYMFAISFFIAACVLYAFALLKLIQYVIKLPFYPSYSSFTFPFVLSAAASSKMAAFNATLGYDSAIMEYIATFQTVVAVASVAYVAIKYIDFIFSNDSKQN